MNSSIVTLATKIEKPHLKDKVIHRNLLYEKLNNIIDIKLAVIYAPAGYGKTTLITSWIENTQEKMPVAWISLDNSDNDEYVFWSYIIKSLEKVYPQSAAKALFTLNNWENINYRSIIRLIINEFIEYNESFVIILDDYHFIDNIEIHKEIEYLISYSPTNMHFIISGRTKPSLNLSKLRIERNLIEIEMKDFIFNVHESNQFINDIMGINVKFETVQLIQKYCEGWLAGIQMMVLTLRNVEEKDDYIKKLTNKNQYVFDYLAEEVFLNQAKEIQKFLLYTSILEQFSEELCDYIFDSRTSSIIIKRLQSMNLFIVPLDNNNHWFRYHHLFKEFLANKFIEEYGLSYTQDLYEKIGRWHEEKGFVSEAIRYYEFGKCYEQEAAVIEKVSLEMLQRSEFRKLDKWMKGLPEVIIQNSCRLNLNRGWIESYNGKLEFTEKYVDMASVFFKDNNLNNPLYYELLVLKATILNSQGHFEEVIKHGNEILEYKNLSDFVKAAALLNLGAAYVAGIDTALAIKYFKECLVLSKKNNNIYPALISARSIVYSLWAKGEVREAKYFIEDMERYVEDFHNSEKSIILGFIYASWAEYYYYTNNIKLAEEYANKGIEIANIEGSNYVSFDCTITLGRVYMLKNLKSKLNEMLYLAEKYAEEDKIFGLKRVVVSFKINVLIYQNRWFEIEDYLAYKAINAKNINWEKGVFNKCNLNNYISYAKYKIENRYFEEAQNVLDMLLILTEKYGFYGISIEILILMTLLMVENKNQNEALLYLEKAVDITVSRENIILFREGKNRIRNLLILLHKKYSNVDRLWVITKELINSFDDTEKFECDIALTKREMEVLRLVSVGFSNEKIVNELHISLNTVKRHLSNIFIKLNVDNRTQAAAKAKGLKIL